MKCLHRKAAIRQRQSNSIEMLRHTTFSHAFVCKVTHSFLIKCYYAEKNMKKAKDFMIQYCLSLTYSYLFTP